MKTINLFSYALTLLFMVFLAACEDTLPDYNHQKEYTLSSFTGVKLGDALRVEILQAEEFSVLATGEDPDLADLELRVENGILTGNYRVGSKSHKRTLVQIYMPKLEELHMHSATTTTLKGFHALQDSATISISGASSLAMDSNWKYLSLEVSGASSATLAGQINGVSASISGDSELMARALDVASFSIHVNGSSEAVVKAGDALTGAVNGDSKLGYIGNPQILQVQVASDSRLYQAGSE